MIEYILARYAVEDAPLSRWIFNKNEDSERRIQMNGYEKPEVKIYEIGDPKNGPALGGGDTSNVLNEDWVT